MLMSKFVYAFSEADRDELLSMGYPLINEVSSSSGEKIFVFLLSEDNPNTVTIYANSLGKYLFGNMLTL